MRTARQPLAYRPKEAAELLGIALSTLYKRRSLGEITFTKFGGATLITAAEIERILAPSSQSAPPE